MSDLTGSVIGDYRLLRLIGKGGMGEVYEATHPQMPTSIALKVLRGDEAGLPREWVERFVREVRLMESLNHPHIMPVYDYGHVDEMLYFSMKLIEGPNLSQWLMKRQFSPETAWQVLRQAAEGLAYGHEQGVIHRDVKPDNILIHDPDGLCQAFVADFGIGKKPGVDRTITDPGSVIGTPAYMSPEAVLGESLDHRSDIYSLGIILYEMLLGIPPFKEQHTHLTAMAHVTKPLPFPTFQRPDFPMSLELVLLKALSKDRNERYQSVRQFIDEFQSALDALTADDRECQFWV